MKGKSWLVVVGIVVVLFAVYGCSYNGMVSSREEVESQWANVEARYQERFDLIPNLVATVKGFAGHEEKIFTEIADSRARLGGVTVDSSITEDPEKLAQFQKSQEALSSGLGRLLALSESYPQLRSNENFLDLQSQIEGINNRIATETRKYNEAAKSYNTKIQSFPDSFIANMSGFQKKAYFQAQEGAKVNPKVEF